MRKIVFIIPYFGKFNNYFQLFLNSCGFNKEIDWIIYTDDDRNFNYPKNVKVVFCTFEDIKNKIQNKFDFKISLETPYKLCDYKPLYGYIFKNEIANYQYWGYCDIDLIFGNISKFLDPIIEKKFDKIFFLGHCTLFKNSFETNRLFLKELNGKLRYKEVLRSNKIEIFDETFNNSINNIFLQENKSIFTEQYQADIYKKDSDYNCVKYDFESSSFIPIRKKNSLFTFENGNIYQYYLENNNLKKKEFLYIHLQIRSMKVNIDNNLERYKIIPNSFEKIEVSIIEKSNFFKIKKKNKNIKTYFYWEIYYLKLRFKNLRRKIKNIVGRI